ncbi:MAG TPA: complex I subunit 1 family protein [Kofleriaceae bacterium]|nr:complex I subunit 1 family protein [Kofleriaceae bacterium]
MRIILRPARLAVLALLLLAVSCGREKDVPDLCATNPQLPGCQVQCVVNSPVLKCPAGSHCDADGTCSVSCVRGDERCGSGTCTAEGRCVESSLLFDILDFPATKWAILILALVMPLASILTWMERRQSAMMQDRLGPNRANIGPIKLKGILHFVADAVKMIFKEDFIPANVHKGLFALAPILAIAPVFIAFAIIPFGPTIYPHALTETIDPYLASAGGDLFRDSIRLQIWQTDFGLIFYFAILTLANYGGTIAGWASYNKWALLGGLRSSSQMMSYEVAMGLSLMGAFLVVGSLEPGLIVAQGATTEMSPANPLNWLFLWQPVGLLLFFTAAIAETKRAPFDIPEGEPEIIGYFVEYSGLRWGLFFLAEFIEIVFISAVITTVFFGGYQVPFLETDGFHGFGMALPLPHVVVVLLQILAFGAKTFLLCWFQLMIRWTLPRFRADQLMNLGWKLLLPLSLANVMVTALIKLLFIKPGGAP